MPTHPPRKTIEGEHTQEQLIDLVYGVFERAFAADGPERGLELLRTTLQGLDASALKGLIYSLGLDTEPAQEDARETRPSG
jgi:hypothetical protein